MLQTLKNWIVEGWHKSPFGNVERWAAFWEWLLHNIIFGFAPIWVPAFGLSFFGLWHIEESFRNGDFAMFAVTLCAISLGFFVKETQTNLRKREILTYAGLMMTMLVGVITRTALAFADKFPSALLRMSLIFWVTTLLVLLAIYLNYRLFTLELEVLDRKTVEERLNAPAKKLSEQAATANHVDGIAV